MKLGRFSRALLITGALICTKSHADNQNNGIYMSVDYLRWKAQQDQMAYAIAVPGFNPNNAFGRPLTNIDQTFESDSGVRAALGYTFCDCWDSCLVATHFKSCSFGSITLPNSILVSSIFPIDNFQLLVGSTASSRWNIQFNTLDWEFGRQWDICEQLTMRSHVGLKWAKIKQLQFINYPLFSGNLKATMPKCSTFTGVGPRIGLNADWCFYNDFSLIGNVSASLLYGKFKGNTTINLTTEENEVLPIIFPFCKKRLRPAVEMLIGISWKADFACLCDNTGTFDIGIGYEAQYWWNQWQTVTNVLQALTSITNNGDLMFHGLTAWASIEF